MLIIAMVLLIDVETPAVYLLDRCWSAVAVQVERQKREQEGPLVPRGVRPMHKKPSFVVELRVIMWRELSAGGATDIGDAQGVHDRSPAALYTSGNSLIFSCSRADFVSPRPHRPSHSAAGESAAEHEYAVDQCLEGERE